MSSVFLADLDGDWINPSQACTNPLFAEEPAVQKPEETRSTKKGSKAAKVSLALEADDSLSSEGAVRPDLIKSAPAKAGGTKATITLSDCLACNGCVTSAETVLIEQQSTVKFLEALKSGAHAKVVLAMSQQSLAAVAESLGMSVETLLPCLHAFWKTLGVHYVTDTSVAADISLLETAAEFVARYRNRRHLAPPPWASPESTVAHSSSHKRFVDRPGQPLGDALAAASAASPSAAIASSSSSSAAVSAPATPTDTPSSCDNNDSDGGGPLPMLASNCPGWICYAEKTHPAILPYISTTKSPQQVMGVLVKQLLAPEIGVAPQDVYHGKISRTHCFIVCHPATTTTTLPPPPFPQ
jgi:iron only hydrogenase large subunit-like protein